MATTLTTLQQEVRRRLNEANNSAATALDSGTNSTPTVTSDAGLTTYINEAQELIARLAVPLPDTGTYTWLTGVAEVRLALFTPGVTGQILWAARALKFGSSALTWASRGALEMGNPGWIGDSTGTPRRWYTSGDSVGMRPIPSAASTSVTAAGYAYPKRLSSGSDEVSSLADAEAHIITLGACWLTCVKNLDDTALAAREPVFRHDFGADMDKMWSRLDEATRVFFPTKPSDVLMGMVPAGAQGAGGKRGGGR